MSAKSRGVATVKNEFFPTPPWAVRRLVEACPILQRFDGRWFEPACGDGAIVEAIGLGEREWTICDLVTTGEDYLTRPHLIGNEAADVGITNPPFTLMQEFADKMQLECVDSFLLGRINFLESAKRHEWFLNNVPDVYRLPDRPSFAHKITCRPKGCKGVLIPWNAPTPVHIACECFADPVFAHSRKPGQDATGYAWFHWGPSATGRIFFLEPTPSSERVDRVVPRAG